MSRRQSRDSLCSTTTMQTDVTTPVHSSPHMKDEISQTEDTIAGSGPRPERQVSMGSEKEEKSRQAERQTFSSSDKEELLADSSEDEVAAEDTSGLTCFPKRYKEQFTGVPKHVPPKDDLVLSGHLEFQSLFATNDMTTPSFTVNRLGAPNNSTVMCGCENISCPFCNVVMSIRNRDPNLDMEN